MGRQVNHRIDLTISGTFFRCSYYELRIQRRFGVLSFLRESGMRGGNLGNT